MKMPIRRIAVSKRFAASKTSGHAGFTLVELMVSIVIVAVLASLIFLFAKRGMQSAKAAKCISNMKQIHSGVIAVMDDGVNTTFNPPRTYLPYAGQQIKPFRQFTWIDLVAEYMGFAEVDGGKYIWNVHPKETIFQNPLSRHSLGGPQAEWDVITKDKEALRGTYAWNNIIGSWTSKNKLPGEVNVTRTSEIPYPAITVLYGESNDDMGIGRVFFNPKHPPQGNYKNGAHCSFVDGHVELIPNQHLTEWKWFKHYMHLKVPKKDLAKPE